MALAGIVAAAWQPWARRVPLCRVAARALSTCSVTPASSASTTSVVRVGTAGGQRLFHGVWLRDHCPCSTCVDHQTHQRQVDTAAIPLGVTPQQASVTAAGDLTVVWGDDGDDGSHTSTYPASWVAQHGHTAETPPTTRAGLPAAWAVPPRVDAARDRSSQVLFDASTFQHRPLPTAAHDDVMTSDAALLEALQCVRDVGFVLVDGTEATEAATAALARRVAAIRPTMYSPDMWMTEVRPDGNDTAYTTNPLAAHTDGCYWQDKPGLQVFHCLAADPNGGDTLLVDGFAVADRLRRHHPEAFAFFASTPLPFHHLDAACDYRALHPVLRLDAATGDVVEFSYNNEDRDVTRLPFGDVPAFYRHLHTLMSVMKDASMEVWLQLRPGTVAFIHNHRVMHGRSGFSSVSGRRLAGCYVNNEEYESRLRALATAAPAPAATGV